MHDADITNSNTLPHEVKIDLNVLGALMLNRVGGHVDGADVVAVDQQSASRRCMKLNEKLAQPSGFCNTISHCAILSFSTGPETVFCRFDDQETRLSPRKTA